MKYTYSLGLLLGVYLLYQPGCDKDKLMFLSFLLMLSALGFMIEHLSQYPRMQLWLERIF